MVGTRAVWLMTAAMCFAGCGSDGDPTGAALALQPSFNVMGNWAGTVSDDDTELDITLVIINNGGPLGMDLAGELTVEDIGSFPFADSYISPLAGATRIATITAADARGFSYELRGDFTNLRMDDGQFDSTNPAVDVDSVYLEATLVRRE